MGFLATADDLALIHNQKNVLASVSNSLQEAKTQGRLLQSCTVPSTKDFYDQPSFQ